MALIIVGGAGWASAQTQASMNGGAATPSQAPQQNDYSAPQVLSSDESSTKKIVIHGSLEEFLASGYPYWQQKSRDEFTRAMISFESGDWKFDASYWYYPYWGYYDLDETTLRYSKGPNTFKVGRFIPAIAQANWDDEWYSGFTFLPNVEGLSYSGRELLERTSAGIAYEGDFGIHQVQFSAFGSSANYGRPLPKNLDRGAIRYQIGLDGLQVGLSYESDLSGRGNREQLRAFDVRFTRPQWIVRGTMLSYGAPGQTAYGYYVDIYHRPKGWSDVTLLFRIEDLSENGPGGSRTQLVQPGVKIRLPFDIGLMVSYGFGPSMNTADMGARWSIGLHKTFRF